MARVSEQSFANRYGRGMELHAYIAGLKNYAPSKEEFRPEGFLALLNRLNGLNTAVANTHTVLRTKMDERDVLLKTGTGIIDLSRRVRDNIGSIVPKGKLSSPYKAVQKECQKMISTSKKKKADDTAPKDGTPVTEETKAKRSTAESGMNAVIQYAKNILETIRTIPNYTSPNPDLTINGYAAKIQAAENAINAVHSAYDGYDKTISERYNLYEGPGGLKETMTRILAYILYEYGKDSQEYMNAENIKY